MLFLFQSPSYFSLTAKEKYAKEPLSCERIEKYMTHLMDAPQWRLASSCEEHLSF